LDAIKHENIKWPTQYGDILPYQSTKNVYWDGLYSARPATKKFALESSANFHTMASKFAEKAIN